MTDWLLALVPQYGTGLLALATFAACIAVPIPASLLMLAAGGFVAAGDLSLPASMTSALAGAVVGDQAGFLLGRWGGSRIAARLGRRAAAFENATRLLARHGVVAVFVSRWLFSALGPYVNLAAGAGGQPWPAFTAAGVFGEMVWVGLYVGVGYAVAGNLEAAASVAVDVLGMLAAGAVAVGLGVRLLWSAKARRDGG